MARYTIDELLRPWTREEVQAKIYAAIAKRGVNTTSWAAGAVVRTMTLGASIVLSAFSNLVVIATKSGFIQWADEDWAPNVAEYLYGVTPLPATFAAGQLRLTNTGGGVFSVEADDLIVQNSRTGKQYRNTTAFALGSLGTVTIDISAVEIGTASNAAAGEITEFVTPLIGVTCTNVAALIASDDEDKDSLRSRSLDKLGSLSPDGPSDAYSYAARGATLANGSNAGITSARPYADGRGTLRVYVRTATGAPTEEQRAAAESACERNAVTLGVTLIVLAAIEVPVTLYYTAQVLNISQSQLDDLRDRIRTAVVSLFSSTAIGGINNRLYGAVITRAVVAAVSELLSFTPHVGSATGPSDVTLAAGQVPVLAGIYAPTIEIVTTPKGASAL